MWCARMRHPGRRRLLAALAGVAVASAAAVPLAVSKADPRGVPHTARRIWRPAPHTTWQWQLTGRLDLSIPAQMYDVDLFDTSVSRIAALHRRGIHVVCYLDAGTWERWRPDAGRFPRSVLGRPNGWPGERWLDIRQLSVLEPIMRARLRRCARKHFDGVEADNVDGYENDTGFALTGAEQLTYNRWLAATAHSLGLSIALKNDVDQAAALQRSFDYALDEQCFQYSECDKLRPFTAHHKAVFEVEYRLPTSRFCSRARTDGFMSMRKRLNLDAFRQACW